MSIQMSILWKPHAEQHTHSYHNLYNILKETKITFIHFNLYLCNYFPRKWSSHQNMHINVQTLVSPLVSHASTPAFWHTHPLVYLLAVPCGSLSQPVLKLSYCPCLRKKKKTQREWKDKYGICLCAKTWICFWHSECRIIEFQFTSKKLIDHQAQTCFSSVV